MDAESCGVEIVARAGFLTILLTSVLQCTIEIARTIWQQPTGLAARSSTYDLPTDRAAPQARLHRRQETRQRGRRAATSSSPSLFDSTSTSTTTIVVNLPLSRRRPHSSSESLLLLPSTLATIPSTTEPVSKPPRLSKLLSSERRMASVDGWAPAKDISGWAASATTHSDNESDSDDEEGQMATGGPSTDWSKVADVLRRGRVKERREELTSIEKLAKNGGASARRRSRRGSGSFPGLD